MWKFKSLKGKDKWLFLLAAGVILCILALPVGKIGKTEADYTNESGNIVENGYDNDDKILNEVGNDGNMENATENRSDYVRELERRVKELLSHVDGVGEVDVLIVLKSSAETVWHTDVDQSRSLTEETDSNGGTRRMEEEKGSSSTVLASSDGKGAPVAEKEIYPELSGIVISAAGGGSPQVQAEISQAMEALFGLPAHKIKILKRVE